MTREDEELRATLLGSWELVLWTNRRPDDVIEHPFGDAPRGLISYTPDGHMSVHMVRPGIPPFNGSPYDAPHDRIVTAFLGYVGYFGRFSVDAAHRTVTHHIEGAWYPDLIGDQLRHCRIEGDRLFLEAETPTGWVTIEWRRAGA